MLSRSSASTPLSSSTLTIAGNYGKTCLPLELTVFVLTNSLCDGSPLREKYAEHSIRRLAAATAGRNEAMASQSRQPDGDHGNGGQEDDFSEDDCSQQIYQSSTAPPPSVKDAVPPPRARFDRLSLQFLYASALVEPADTHVNYHALFTLKVQVRGGEV